MGTPEGLKLHCPAFHTRGIPVRTAENTPGRDEGTGERASSDQPVIAPPSVRKRRATVSGVETDRKSMFFRSPG